MENTYKYHVHLFKDVSDWDNEEGTGITNWIVLDETEFINGTEEDLNKWLNLFGLEFEDFEEFADEDNDFCDNRYDLDQIEDGEGIKDANGKFIANYSLYVTKYTRVKE